MVGSKKKHILKTLSASHLRAIGSVAAHWSSLELTLLWAVARAANISLPNAITLVGSQGADAWGAMLIAFTGDSKQVTRAKTPTELDKILSELTELKGKRNEVVHAGWYERRGIIASAMPPSAKQHALGFGIKKRGTAVLVDIEMNSSDMLEIASRIEALEQSISAWIATTLPDLEGSDAEHEVRQRAPTKPLKSLLTVGKK